MQKHITFTTDYQAPRGSMVLDMQGHEVGVVTSCLRLDDESVAWQVEADVENDVIVDQVQIFERTGLSRGINA